MQNIFIGQTLTSIVKGVILVPVIDAAGSVDDLMIGRDNFDLLKSGGVKASTEITRLLVACRAFCQLVK